MTEGNPIFHDGGEKLTVLNSGRVRGFFLLLLLLPPGASTVAHALSSDTGDRGFVFRHLRPDIVPPNKISRFTFEVSNGCHLSSFVSDVNCKSCLEI